MGWFYGCRRQHCKCLMFVGASSDWPVHWAQMSHGLFDAAPYFVHDQMRGYIDPYTLGRSLRRGSLEWVTGDCLVLVCGAELGWWASWLYCGDSRPPWSRKPGYVISFSPPPKESCLERIERRSSGSKLVCSLV
ncbi:hypothetical protein GW17_00036855 [Ensete ventricosum]|nr:hypothetical protein GW17_00036855 [Ensete ventricosum]